jgi:thiol-disulfide isomerase/thioredoxin
MRKIKTLLIILSLVLLGCGIGKAKAAEKVKVYLFYGDGCPYCENAMTFFDNLDDKYKDKIELVKYEVWNDEENSKLMENVAAVLDEEVSGVPFIVVGEEPFSGYSEEYDKSILKAIDKELEKDKPYDVLEHVSVDETNSAKENKTSSNDLLTFLSLGCIFIGIVGLVIYAKKSVN